MIGTSSDSQCAEHEHGHDNITMDEEAYTVQQWCRRCRSNVARGFQVTQRRQMIGMFTLSPSWSLCLADVRTYDARNAERRIRS